MGDWKTPELADTICEGLSEGIPLRQIARLNGFSKSAFYDWVNSDEEFAGRIARAREIGFDHIAEEALEIADDGSNDWMEREGRTIVDSDHVQRSRLRIDTRLKLLAKWDPRRYGDATMIKHADANGETIELDPVARATRLAGIMKQIEARKEGGDGE